MRSVLAIGAYDRDNFGDYLFLKLLHYALSDAIIIPGSYLYSHSDDYNLSTTPYSYALANHKFDSIWVVGGELGGVKVNDALAMSINERSSPYSKARNYKRLIGSPLHSHSLAYLPDVKLYSENRDTPMIVNSVGLSHASSVTPHARRLLSQASYLSVRDKESSERIKSIPHSLSPDVIHCYSHYYTPTKLPDDLQYIIFQANASYIRERGISAIADQLKRSYLTHGIAYLFVAAGIAPGHDSFSQLNSLKKRLASLSVPSTVLATRNPEKIVDYISHARAVIATSLHIRIVAESYNVLRISLENGKVTRYVKSWDSDFPFDVKIDEITNALQETLARTSIGHRLADIAHSNLHEAIVHLPPATANNESLSAQHMENTFLQSAFSHASEQIIKFNSTYDQLRQENEFIGQQLSLTSQELNLHKEDLLRIHASRSWKLYKQLKRLLN